jgi:hypothetical protein
MPCLEASALNDNEGIAFLRAVLDRSGHTGVPTRPPTGRERTILACDPLDPIWWPAKGGPLL